MPSLFFPNLNALRLALVSGLVPDSISRAPASAGFDAHGRLWLEPIELLPRESLAALSRLGVQALGGMGVPAAPVDCWAELLPLQPAHVPFADSVLFLVPEKTLARFVARLQRPTPTAFGLRLSEDADYQFAWVVVDRPPGDLLTLVREPHSAFEAFTRQSPRVWVSYGMEHPLPDYLTAPDGAFLLVRPPRDVMPVYGELPLPELEEFVLSPVHLACATTTPRAPSIPVPVTLVPRSDRGRESLWVLDGQHEREFWEFCASVDASAASRLEVAEVSVGDTSRLIIRVVEGRGGLVLPLVVRGFCREPRVPNLFVPVDRTIRPSLRVSELVRACGVRPGFVTWVEANPDGGVATHTVAESCFRPVAECLDYETPRVTHLRVETAHDLFSLAKFAAMTDVLPSPEPAPVPMPYPQRSEELPSEIEAAPPAGGWLRRSLRKLVSRLRTESASEETQQLLNPLSEPSPIVAAGPHVERLASPDALLHGHDWSARRRELESGLFHDLPRLGPSGRAERWAELAAVYSAIGNNVDAAVCWMNAVWETATPPPEWLEQWLTVEARAARIPDPSARIDRLLSEPGRPGVGRLVAAYTASIGLSASPPPEFTTSLPRLLSFLDQHFDDVPVRAVWLARAAATRVCDGDSLGLARWRDRVLARLAERGPGLDLDEPSFLRFHGTASAERFQAAREWLIRSREAALSWIQRQPAGRLRWAGLDCESECTAAYAQFMFAWGLGCLGERMKAKDWAGKARKLVSRVTGPRVEAAAHAVMGDLFLLRVRDAQEGRPPKSGLPPELQSRLDSLPQLARYAVDRLREHSQILEPIERVHAFRGLDLRAILGSDPLGDRLYLLASEGDRARLITQAYDLILLCHEHPTTDVVPRVVLTLLELASALDHAALPRVLELLPAALDWTEAWLSNSKVSDSERQARLLRYQTRMLSTGFWASAMLDPPNPGIIAELVRRLISAGDRMRPALLASSGHAFRAIRRLGLGSTAEQLVRYLDPSQSGMRKVPSRVRLAAGWFTAGNEDAGNRILDEARELLYLSPAMDLRTKTQLAVAYAETLGFAPGRIAHGRLEEIFQRLGPVEGMSSTNSYFTLRPLQLVDAIVRSVVTEEFTLNPSVRGWLDDDEFLIRGRIHRDLANLLREQDIR